MKCGTYANYTIGKCRCEECRRANREYKRGRTRREIEGRPHFVPAEPVRERWLKLRELGMSDDEIERAAGIDDKVSDALFHKHWRTGKPVQRMKRENAERIMAVRKRKPLPGTVMSSAIAPQLVLDLMALGYSAVWISERIGLSYQGRDRLLQYSHRASTLAALVRLHGSTVERAPESPEASRSRNFAAKRRGIGRRAS